MVRTDSHQLRAVAGDSDLAEAVKVVTRAHKTLIWERTRHMLRLRSALREYFPAALAAFEDLTAPTRWSCWPRRRTRPAAARLTTTQIRAALKRARRRDSGPQGRARSRPRCAPSSWPSQRRWPGPTRPPCGRQVAIIAALNSRSTRCRSRSKPILGSTRTLRSTSASPGLGQILGARVLGRVRRRPRPATAAPGPARTTPAPSPITRQSGKKKVVLARYVRNDRLARRPAPAGVLPR